MPERRVHVILIAPEAQPIQVEGVFHEFTPAQRVGRSAVVMVIAVFLAATLIPIPIIHLLGIPMLLIGGVVLSIRQLSMVGRLAPVRIACPKCGALNRVGGGLGYRSTAPQERMCDSCRRGLTLRIEPADSPTVIEDAGQTS